jgi:hypothetical protein
MHSIITDGFMQQMLAASKGYCVMILRAGPKRNRTGTDKIIWEHGRRNFQLRAGGIMSIVCPVVDGGEIKGIGIFNRNAEETKRIMDEDPAYWRESFCLKRTYVAGPRRFPGKMKRQINKDKL